jgi:hypothetical protein
MRRSKPVVCCRILVEYVIVKLVVVASTGLEMGQKIRKLRT